MKLRDRVKELRRVPAGDLIPNPKNWRTHPKAQQDALRGILAEVGIAGAVLARETPAGLMLIDGHMRADTDPTAIWPVLVLDVTEAEADKLLATYDPVAAMAETDPVKLDALLREVDTGCEALQAMLAELADDAGLYQDSPEIVEDEVPEPPVDPVTKPGDLWLLGEHRLLCGDSTKVESAERLILETASIAFTSPPYGAGNVAKLRDHYVKGADKRESFYDKHEDSPASWGTLMRGWFGAIRPYVDAVFCNVQMLADNKRTMLEWLFENREDFVDVVVWDKVNAAPQMQANVLSNAFEFLFVFGGTGSRAIPLAAFHGNIQNIVRLDPRKEQNEFAGEHRAIMPLALPVWVLRDLCPDAVSVVDPFCGTGTTLIAAEQLKRRCYGMEISPAYCDVIVQRWEKLTGKKAECQSKRT